MVPRTVGDLSTDELQHIIEQSIDGRLSVWLTQIHDALSAPEDEGGAQLRPEFEESLRRALEQADVGNVIGLPALSCPTTEMCH